MRNIYEMAVKTMKPEDIDHNCFGSDLYLKVNSISKQLVKQYDFRFSVETFISQIDHCLWFDIPFAYTPYWEECCKG